MKPIEGLYAITPEEADTARLLEQLALALDGGVRTVQYRNKRGTRQQQSAQAGALLELCRRYEVPLIINDHLDLALEINADGLHLGMEDGSVAEARSRLGPGKILGVSCYNSMEKARDAVRLQADYAAFGSVYPSLTKPAAVRAPLSLFAEARKEIGIPLVAIGGITPANAAAVISAGASALAVISSLFDADEITAAARRFSSLFEPDPHS